MDNINIMDNIENIDDTFTNNTTVVSETNLNLPINLTSNDNIININNNINNIDIDNNNIDNMLNSDITNLSNDSNNNITNQITDHIIDILPVIELSIDNNNLDNISNYLENNVSTNPLTFLNNKLNNLDNLDNIDNPAKLLTNNPLNHLSIIPDNKNTIGFTSMETQDFLAFNNTQTTSKHISNSNNYNTHNNHNHNNHNNHNSIDKSLISNSTGVDSEFSYRKSIVASKIPVDIKVNSNKNVRLSKAQKKTKNSTDDTDYLYNYLQDYQRNIIINRFNYVLLIIKAMEIIEVYALTKDNINKKETVIKALNRIVMIDLDLDDFDARLFLSSIDNIIELFIDCSTTRKYETTLGVKKSSKHCNIKINNNNNTNTNMINNMINNNDNNIDEQTLASCGQIIYSIVDKLITIVVKQQYTADKIFVNMATLTEILIILTDKYYYLNNLEIKVIVSNAIDIFIKEKLSYIIDIDSNKKIDLIKSLDTIPMLIDVIISVKNTQYNINKKELMRSRTSKSTFCGFLCCKNNKNNYDMS